MGVGRRAGLDRIVLTVVNKLCLPRLVLPYYLVWFSTNSDTCRQDLLSAHDGSIVVILEGKSVYFTPERIVFCCCCNYVIYFCFCYRGKMSSLLFDVQSTWTGTKLGFFFRRIDRRIDHHSIFVLSFEKPLDLDACKCHTVHRGYLPK